MTDGPQALRLGVGAAGAGRSMVRSAAICAFPRGPGIPYA
jgi:hypothetical protein